MNKRRQQNIRKNRAWKRDDHRARRGLGTPEPIPAHVREGERCPTCNHTVYHRVVHLDGHCLRLETENFSLKSWQTPNF